MERGVRLAQICPARIAPGSVEEKSYCSLNILE
jgi:hypothetical protein